MIKRLMPVLCLLAAACSNEDAPQVNEAQAAAAIDNAQRMQRAADGHTIPGLPISDDDSQLKPGQLPPAFEGRWGRTPADCDIARSDVTGLLVVRGSTMTFYEGAAEAKVVGGASRYKVVTDLTFRGDRPVVRRNTLELTNGGTVLQRTEQSPAKTFRYERC